MSLRAGRFRLKLLVLAGLLALAAASLGAQQTPQEKTAKRPHAKLPRPVRLDNVDVRRDRATGELHLQSSGEPARATTAPQIRVGVNLVEVGCNVQGANGNELRGLTRDDFRVFEDGLEQHIDYFDASSEPLHLALILDASPSVLRDESEMKQAARALLDHLNPLDELAVVTFAAHTFLVLPFSHDRAQIEQAIASVNVRSLVGDTGGSNIYQSVYLTAQRLFPNLAGRKAIVLLTDGQDSGLGLTWNPESAMPLRHDPDRLTFEDLARALGAKGVEVYAISTEPRPKAMTAAWLAARENQTLVNAEARQLGVPPYTAYLAELVRRAGGALYFLRETPALADVYSRIAQKLRAQYMLGYYPGDSPPPRESPLISELPHGESGWRSLRVEVLHHAGARATHRNAYYLPAQSP